MLDDEVTVNVVVPTFVGSWIDMAVTVALAAPDGVNTPAAVTVPPVADHVTAVLKLPVPVRFALHVEVCVIRIALGAHVTVTAETLDAVPTETVAVPDFVVSWTEVAVIVALPAAAGVYTPPAVIVPLVADHVTALLKFPVPETAAVHAEVWLGKIETGLHVTVTDETAEDVLTATLAVATLLVSCVEVAVMVAVPPPDGVNNPAGVIVPLVAAQLTAALNAPVPKTVAAHWLDWPI